MLILDLGSGTVPLTIRELRNYFPKGSIPDDAKIIHIDNKIRHKDYIIINLDLNKDIEWDDGSVDIVWASHIIEHLYDAVRFIEEIWRVLKPGGTCILKYPDAETGFRMATGSPDHKHLFNKESFKECFDPKGVAYGMVTDKKIAFDISFISPPEEQEVTLKMVKI